MPSIAFSSLKVSHKCTGLPGLRWGSLSVPRLPSRISGMRGNRKERGGKGRKGGKGKGRRGKGRGRGGVGEEEEKDEWKGKGTEEGKGRGGEKGREGIFSHHEILDPHTQTPTHIHVYIMSE